ncbi:hypothetical protein LCM23_13035 [Cytobacillus kochii]|uniref:hypothetical protein n=1 Tax=Cytobacillus kochii TaxID=859143 RepID=UPI001CD3FC53|nr:hypothetical protein [Cytobacillus kochii]MCA1027019.1 hypothetical protein [Cytobacillus kochii]
MKNLIIRIIFKSGRITEINSKDFYQGQFRQWIDRNFIKNSHETYGWVVWDDCLINVSEIEKVEEVK